MGSFLEVFLVAESPVKTELKAEVGFLILNRPQARNALNLEAYRAIPGAVAALLEAGVKVVVVRGAGEKAFGAGSDITEFPKLRFGRQEAISYNRAEEDALRALEECPVPTLAMIFGYCVGGGLEVALACDLRLASEGALFGATPAKLGVAFSRQNIQRLCRIIGPAWAKELLLTGELVDARRALVMGLVNRVVPEEELEAETLALAQTLASNAPISLRQMKRVLNAWLEVEDVPDGEGGGLLLECYESQDYREGVRAFLEKRKPRFRGR